MEQEEAARLLASSPSEFDGDIEPVCACPIRDLRHLLRVKLHQIAHGQEQTIREALLFVAK